VSPGAPHGTERAPPGRISKPNEKALCAKRFEVVEVLEGERHPATSRAILKPDRPFVLTAEATQIIASRIDHCRTR
jgi:hypothetical protein